MKNRKYQDWIDAASDDLDMGRLALGNGYWSHVCFLSQQVSKRV